MTLKKTNVQEFNLSEKIRTIEDRQGYVYNCIVKKEIKEFIKRFKEELNDKEMCCVHLEGDDDCACNFASEFVKNLIDKLAGDELSQKSTKMSK